MLKEFRNNKILLAYYGGSTAYGTKTTNSDIDVIVVLDDIKGSMHISNEELGIEYYVFGKEDFERKMTFNSEVTPYLRVFNDDILAEVDPIILDESFKSKYEEYRTRDFGSYIKNYIDSVIEYYQPFLSEDALKKNMYHLYRIEDQVKNYQTNGNFQLSTNPGVTEKMMVFKDNYKTQSILHLNELREILKYLKEVKRNVTN